MLTKSLSSLLLVSLTALAGLNAQGTNVTTNNGSVSVNTGNSNVTVTPTNVTVSTGNTTVSTGNTTTVSTNTTNSNGNVGGEKKSKGIAFDHVFIIVFENTDFEVAYNEPYFKKLSQQGLFYTNFSAITHPSQPNYFALTAGSTFGVDNNSTNITGLSIADTLEEKNLTWKNYAENFPGNCFLGENNTNKLYVRKHTPFISYANINSNPARCANVANETVYQSDLNKGTIPDYVFYTPNMNNDAHDTNITFAAKYLEGFLTPLLASNSSLPNNTLIIITFDEGSYDNGKGTYTEGGKPSTPVPGAASSIVYSGIMISLLSFTTIFFNLL
ncbi:10023_t:CDS:2 [Ambispora gerdemannii]|uniref:10023_t:CDS:1 n=1 Tax=Ambispora gerdemannii TaxID=144530 RepID=A0A9N8VNK4_9GLOM|nr:10023_t:CDS:2 [Ambispora gerdemannii]